jgi:aryl-alcohol dehydrogenase-like predicted oxidoreductase
MRTIPTPWLNREVPVLGFGCASFGSRVSAGDGSRAIAHAIDHGIAWFDVAPPYGDGHAEALLGRAVRGQRAKVVICTKFGIAPPQVPIAARLVRPLARKVVSALPQLRAAAARGRRVGKRLPIDPKAIEASVIRSLRQLCTDYIDVLAVHEPSLDDAANNEIFNVLRRLIERGVVRAISVAGSVESLETVARNRQPIEIAQFPDTPFSNAAAELRAAFPTTKPMFVTHGVIGASVPRRLAQASTAQRARLDAVAERHGFELTAWPYDLLLRFAFSNNPDGVVILSMFDPRHIEANIAAARLPPAPGLAGQIRAALAEPISTGKQAARRSG